MNPILKNPLQAILLLIGICFLMPACSILNGENEPPVKYVGEIEIVTGTPRLIREGESSTATEKLQLFAGDIIITDQGSRVRLRMVDETTINLGEETEFRVVSYIDSTERATAQLKLIKGAFRIKTGRIPKKQNATFEVSTPSAVIGVRGTDFWGGDIFEDSKIDVALLSPGEIAVSNPFGAVTISLVGYGTTVAPGVSPTPPELWQPDKAQRAIASTQI